MPDANMRQYIEEQDSSLLYTLAYPVWRTWLFLSSSFCGPPHRGRGVASFTRGRRALLDCAGTGIDISTTHLKPYECSSSSMLEVRLRSYRLSTI